MSRLFGPMRQIGIVVRDIEKAMRHWVEVCGVGPWFYAEQLPMDEFRYKGRTYDLKVSIALANSGDVQLELIQQRNDVPSLYGDFLAAGHEGMQHWSSWPVNYHEIRDRALRSGWQIGQEGDTPRGPFIYFLNEGHPGTVIEMAEDGSRPHRLTFWPAPFREKRPTYFAMWLISAMSRYSRLQSNFIPLSDGKPQALGGLPHPPMIMRHLGVRQAEMSERIVDRIGKGRNTPDIR